jgi:hypothetical protein
MLCLHVSELFVGTSSYALGLDFFARGLIAMLQRKDLSGVEYALRGTTVQQV